MGKNIHTGFKADILRPEQLRMKWPIEFGCQNSELQNGASIFIYPLDASRKPNSVELRQVKTPLAN